MFQSTIIFLQVDGLAIRKSQGLHHAQKLSSLPDRPCHFKMSLISFEIKNDNRYNKNCTRSLLFQHLAERKLSSILATENDYLG